MIPQHIIARLKERMNAHAINEMEALLYTAPDEMEIYVTFYQNLVGPESKIIDYVPDQIFFSKNDVELSLMEFNICWLHNIRPDFGNETETSAFPYLAITLGDLKIGKLLHPRKLAFLDEETAKIMRRLILIKLVEAIYNM